MTSQLWWPWWSSRWNWKPGDTNSNPVNALFNFYFYKSFLLVSLFHKTYFCLNEEEKNEKPSQQKHFFFLHVEIIPDRLFQYPLHLPVCSSSESGSPVKSILLWLVNQIIPVHRNLMDLFGWRQCLALSYILLVKKSRRNSNIRLIFCVLFIH